MVNKYYSPPHLGGVETVVRTLSEGLVEHAGAQVRALVCNEGRERVEETIGGVRVVRLPRRAGAGKPSDFCGTQSWGRV